LREAQKNRRTTYAQIGRVTVWIGAIVGGWFLGGVVMSLARHHPWTAAAALVAAGLLALGAYRWQEGRWDRLRRERDEARSVAAEGWSDEDWHERSHELPPALGYSPDRWWVGPFIAFALLVGVAWVAGKTQHSHLIRNYCWYGAVSGPQLAECESHVSVSRIESLNTNAARFAKGRLEKCLADAGPYCEPDREQIEAEEQRE